MVGTYTKIPSLGGICEDLPVLRRYCLPQMLDMTVG